MKPKVYRFDVGTAAPLYNTRYRLFVEKTAYDRLEKKYLNLLKEVRRVKYGTETWSEENENQ